MIPDAEKLAVAWAKANGALSALLQGRVATRLPKGWVSPFLRVVMLPGGDIDAEADLGTAFLQWDVYAHKPDDDAPDYPTASLVARTLLHEAQIWTPAAIGGNGFLYGFGVFRGPGRVEEPDTGWARYMVEMQASIRA